jgi:hypothetical protein
MHVSLSLPNKVWETYCFCSISYYYYYFYFYYSSLSSPGIYSEHHNLPTNEMSLKSDNAEFLWYCGDHFEHGDRRIAPLMVTYHYVKCYVSIIIDLEVININVRNFNFPIGFYSNPHPL